MRPIGSPDNRLIARVIVWLGLSVLLLWYLWRGTESIAFSSFYHVRRSVPSIWNAFHTSLPKIGNGAMLEIVFAIAVATLLLGVLALFWLALIPSDDEIAESGAELPPA